jgi:hypothetical protein
MKYTTEVRNGNLLNTQGRTVNILANLLDETVGTSTYRIHKISKLPLNPKERKYL